MDKNQARKFRIKPGQKILILNPPVDFKISFDLKVNIVTKLQKGVDAIYLFTKNLNELKSYFKKAVRLLNDKNFLWLIYPKSSSSIKADINRDVILNFTKDYPVKISSLVSYNDIWSAFLIRNIGQEDLKRKSTDPKQFLPFIDFEKRLVIPPEDFLKILKKNKKALEKFEKLSFTHKKEYIQAILEAKKPETRLRRIEKTIEMLSK